MPEMIRPLSFCWLAATFTHAAATYVPSNVTPPPIDREFRGAWVATVKNIDWPSKPGLSVAQQKTELLAILDRCRQLKLNVVIFQVRAACDALYPSKIEPWSEYLTGVQGKAPNPFWDPLEFAVSEAHTRGLELHAWFNPYRARHTSGFSPLAKSHISRTRPSLVKTYGAHLWLDPGLREVQDYSMSVILDVLRRYDIDGVHMDDYFYPYPEKDSSGKVIPFPDWTSWNKYKDSGGKLQRDDWRRENVNTFIARAYREVTAAKPWVKCGVSPFGIYRPGFPTQIKGFDQYASLYADPRTWLANGWLDYLAPQLYWRIDPPAQSFPVLLKWWTENNPKNRQIVAGMNTFAVATGTNKWPATEITRQVEITRQQLGASGHIHWNVSALMQNKGGVADELARSEYARLALSPPLAATGHQKISAPTVTVLPANNSVRFRVSTPQPRDVRWWLIQTKQRGLWTVEIRPGSDELEYVMSGPEIFCARPVDRFGEVGAAAILEQVRAIK